MKTKTFYWARALALSLGIAVRVQAVSTIQFTRTAFTVAESAGTVHLSLQRTGDPNTTASVDYFTADGTATNGLKYTAVSGKLTFGANETNKIIEVPILNEGFVESTRIFHVRLSNPSAGATLGVLTNATVSITDDDFGTRPHFDFGIQFQFAISSVAEDASAVAISIVRGDDGTLPVTVGLFTTDLTASSGVDYTGATNTLSFAPQERLKFVSIPIQNNTLKQPNRTFRVTLANPKGAKLGTQTTSVVTITDNDQGFEFDFASYSVAEDAGVARIGVLRGTDATNGTVTVDFATSDATATSGLDYSRITNTLSFAPGESLKLVAVPILNDGVKEPSKDFRVILSNPTGGTVLGSRTIAPVTIVDNDPGIGFEIAGYTARENADAITVTVLRGNDGALGPLAVNYAASNLTALAGQDYQAVSGTLAFEQNETVKTITIPILRNPLVTKNRSFSVILSDPTGGILGRTNTSVTILGATALGTYRTLAPRFETALRIARDGESDAVTWIGEGQLQKSDSPAGPWQTLAKVKAPYGVQSALPAAFYRVTRPRPVNVYIPSSYDGQKRIPLVILLHGHGGASGSADFEESYMLLRPLAEARGFLYCHPDGTVGLANDQFWNATDGCCDFFNAGPDDAGYLRALIEEISGQFAVDPKRVFLVGHSNGAFMAYRMACESADLIAGIASLAGTTFLDPNRCVPAQPVNILHIHGTADPGVPYAGGANQQAPPYAPSNMAAFPGALQTVQFWAGYNGASGAVTDSAPSLDLTTDVAGVDTVITRYTNHPPGGAVELWTIKGASHYPTLSAKFSPLVIDWLLAHPKP